MYTSWITIDNVQRAVTPKAGKSELRFLRFATYITVIYICIKFQENISNSFQVTEWTQIHYRKHYFQSSKGHNSKSRLTRITLLKFCTSSYDALHLFEVSLKISGRVFNLQSEHMYIVKMAIFNIYYVQRAGTTKVG